MNSGIYAYWDNVKNYYVYVGKDSNIDIKYNRNYKHMLPSNYNKQQINRILQNNPERYDYRIIIKGNYNDWQLNQMEKICIKSFKTYKYDYPLRNVFNFTKGGDGFDSGENHPLYRDDLDDEEIINLYINNEFNIYEISEKLNTTPQTISYRLNKNNIILQKERKHNGRNNPNVKYNIWDTSCCQYLKPVMLKKNSNNKLKKIFTLKYKGQHINIGCFIDFTTPEIIHDLICEAIEDYSE